MLRISELLDKNSCWNKARDDELMFILLDRDQAAPATVMAWVKERLRLCLNDEEDAQISSAIEWAETVKQKHLEKGGSWILFKHAKPLNGQLVRVLFEDGVEWTAKFYPPGVFINEHGGTRDTLAIFWKNV